MGFSRRFKNAVHCRRVVERIFSLSGKKKFGERNGRSGWRRYPLEVAEIDLEVAEKIILHFGDKDKKSQKKI